MLEISTTLQDPKNAEVVVPHNISNSMVHPLQKPNGSWKMTVDHK